MGSPLFTIKKSVLVNCFLLITSNVFAQNNLATVSILPQTVREVSIGTTRDELYALLPDLETWVDSIGNETTVGKEIENDAFFTDVIFGIRENKVSFITLSGPEKSTSKTYLDSITPIIVEKCLHDLGTTFYAKNALVIPAQIENGTDDEIMFNKALATWQINENVKGALIITTPSSYAQMEQLNDYFFSKYRFVVYENESDGVNIFLGKHRAVDTDSLVNNVFDELNLQ